MSSQQVRFTPPGAFPARVVSIGELTPEQVAALTAPFDPLSKPAALVTLSEVALTVDLSGVTLPAQYVVSAYFWVFGSAGEFGPLAYNPTPSPFKTKLWRLGPDVTSAEVTNGDTLTVTLRKPLSVAHIAVVVQGIAELRRV